MSFFSSGGLRILVLCFLCSGIALSGCNNSGIKATIRAGSGSQQTQIELPEDSLTVAVGGLTELKPVLKIGGKLSAEVSNIVWSTSSEGLFDIVSDNSTRITSIKGLKIGVSDLTGTYKTTKQVFTVQVTEASTITKPSITTATTTVNVTHPPSLTFLSLTTSEEEAFVNSTYQISVTKSLGSKVSYYYKDTDTACNADTLNTWTLVESSIAESLYEWDLSGLPQGPYFLCARVETEGYASVYVRSAGALTITDSFVLGARNTRSIRWYERSVIGPTAMAIDESRLFVADLVGRVLVWNKVPTLTRTPHDFMLGGTVGVTRNTFAQSITGIATNGVQLAVADTYNNRVLIWQSMPTSSSSEPDIVLGQPDFTSNTVNNGGLSARSLNNPRGLAFTASGLVVVDNANHRVLIWTSLPTQNFQDANVVVGQSDFVTGTLGTSATKLNYPHGVDVGPGGELIVSDTSNNRILIWETFPTTSGASASKVLGQPNFTSSTANSGGLSAQSLAAPGSLKRSGNKLIVLDALNYRLLGWDSASFSNQQPASIVLDQANLASAAYNENYLLGAALTMSGEKVLRSYTIGNRIDIWTAWPSDHGQASHLVLPNDCGPSCGVQIATSGPYPDTLNSPSDFHATENYLFVADVFANRIMAWRGVPQRMDQPADFAIGQTDFYRGEGYANPSSEFTLRNPRGVFQSGSKLIVADTGNNRVLIWNSIPDDFNVSADVVLGQPNFASNQSNQGVAASASTLSGPTKVYVSGGKLYISDSGNHRVLVWNSIPTSSGTAANFAIGQPNLTTVSAGVTSSKLNYPGSIWIEGTQLYVADSGNHRVVVWNVLPTASGAAANFAIGQSNLTTGVANQGGISAARMNSPSGLMIDAGKLYVTDQQNSRVLIWDLLPTASNSSASRVFGQPNMTGSTNNNGGVSAISLSGPTAVGRVDGKFLVLDSGIGRLLVRPTL